MKTKKKTETQIRELECNEAESLIAAGAIVVTEIGNENTYYQNERGQRLFCKNYPNDLPRCGDAAAQLAEEWGCDYSDALVYCNMD